MLSDQSGQSRAVRAIAIAALTISLGLVGALVTVYIRFESQLALSQAADSLADTLTQLALVVSLFVSARPPDRAHHYGHQRAQPIAALVAAVMIGVVSIEVIREAIKALVIGAEPSMHWSLPVVFAGKAALKLALGVICYRVQSTDDSNPVLRAVFVDARNDTVLSLLSVGGYFVARYGNTSLDAYLAIPIALWIAWSGLDLARDTVPLLMGEAPSDDRQRELAAIIEEVEGVHSVRRLRAQHVGVELDLDVHVLADPSLTLREAHDLGRLVEQRLVDEVDVCHALVRVEPEHTGSGSGSESTSGSAARSSPRQRD